MFSSLALTVWAALAVQTEASSASAKESQRLHLTYVLARAPRHALLRIDKGILTTINLAATVKLFGSSDKYIGLVTEGRDGRKFVQFDARTGELLGEVLLPPNCLVTGDVSGPVEGILFDDAEPVACFLALFSDPDRTTVTEVNVNTGALESTTIPSKTRGAAGLFALPKSKVGVYYAEDNQGIRVTGTFDLKTNAYADLFAVGQGRTTSAC